MGYWYRAGMLSVANGSTAVTGNLTGWTSTVRAGDLLFIGNNPAVEIGAVGDDNVSLTLVEPWPFTSVTDGAYAIVQGLLWNDTTRLANDVANALANATEILSGIGVPANTLGSDGSAYFRQDVAELYFKTSGVWGAAISLVGPQGAKGDKGDKGDSGATGATGAGYGGSGTDTLDLSTSGSRALTIGTGFAYKVGQNVRFAHDTTHYMEGQVSSYTGGVLTITPARVVGTGSFSSWTAGITGDQGAQGIQGIQGAAGSPNALSVSSVTTGAPGTDAAVTIAGTSPAQTIAFTIPRGADGTNGADGADGSILTATSATSVTAGTGDKAFTLDAVANFVVNQRVRVASASATGNFMSGLVKSYTSGTKSLVVTVDLLGASPAAATDWNISISGEKGDQGAPGGFGSLDATKGNLIAGDGTAFRTVTIGDDGTVPVADSTQTAGISWVALNADISGSAWASSDVASAATCDIGAATTPVVRITGTTAITSFGTATNALRIVRFASSLVLTYNGTSLVLPGIGNIVTNAGDSGIFVSDASGNWRCVTWNPIGFIPREKLTGNRTYYVRADGSDSNNGLANTSGGAFLTIQKAIDTAAALDISVFNVTIQVAAGTYTGSIVVTGPWVGSGDVNLTGDTTTPSNVVLNTASTTLTLNSGARLNVGGFKVISGGHGLSANSFSTLNVTGAMEYGACTIDHIAITQAAVNIRADYTISGACRYHWDAANLSVLQCNGGRTITVTGTPAWSLGFANCVTSYILCNLDTFTGSATGVRYRISFNGIINTNGGGASYFPGSSAGVLTAPGVYA